MPEAFASTAMVALALAGLRKQGVPLPEAPTTTGLRHAAPPTLPVHRKRHLLDSVLQSHGPLALLRVGEVLPAFRADPLLHVLLRAENPLALLERWRRLERYGHARHRTDVLDATAASVVLRHVALTGPAPGESEDLLVLGVLVGLLRAFGCADVTALLDTTEVAEANGAWRDPARGEPTATWRIAWGAAPAVTAAAPPPCTMGFEECTEAAQLAVLVAANSGGTLRLASAAARLDLQPRTLQRRLAQHGLTLSAIARAVQVQMAARMLAESDAPLAVVGFACGFTDQAHFTRSFRNRLNLTPGAYRALLAPNAPVRHGGSMVRKDFAREGA